MDKIKLYEDFHGKICEEDFEIELESMYEVTLLGEAIAIEYKCQKDHLGDKEKEIYRHEFKKGSLLLTNGTDLIIFGKFKITNRGIEG